MAQINLSNISEFRDVNHFQHPDLRRDRSGNIRGKVFFRIDEGRNFYLAQWNWFERILHRFGLYHREFRRQALIRSLEHHFGCDAKTLGTREGFREKLSLIFREKILEKDSIEREVPPARARSLPPMAEQSESSTQEKAADPIVSPFLTKFFSPDGTPEETLALFGSLSSEKKVESIHALLPALYKWKRENGDEAMGNKISHTLILLHTSDLEESWTKALEERPVAFALLYSLVYDFADDMVSRVPTTQRESYYELLKKIPPIIDLVFPAPHRIDERYLPELEKLAVAVGREKLPGIIESFEGSDRFFRDLIEQFSNKYEYYSKASSSLFWPFYTYSLNKLLSAGSWKEKIDRTFRYLEDSVPHEQLRSLDLASLPFPLACRWQLRENLPFDLFRFFKGWDRSKDTLEGYRLSPEELGKVRAFFTSLQPDAIDRFLGQSKTLYEEIKRTGEWNTFKEQANHFLDLKKYFENFSSLPSLDADLIEAWSDFFPDVTSDLLERLDRPQLRSLLRAKKAFLDKISFNHLVEWWVEEDEFSLVMALMEEFATRLPGIDLDTLLGCNQWERLNEKPWKFSYFWALHSEKIGENPKNHLVESFEGNALLGTSEYLQLKQIIQSHSPKMFDYAKFLIWLEKKEFNEGVLRDSLLPDDISPFLQDKAFDVFREFVYSLTTHPEGNKLIREKAVIWLAGCAQQNEQKLAELLLSRHPFLSFDDFIDRHSDIKVRHEGNAYSLHRFILSTIPTLEQKINDSTSQEIDLTDEEMFAVRRLYGLLNLDEISRTPDAILVRVEEAKHFVDRLMHNRADSSDFVIQAKSSTQSNQTIDIPVHKVILEAGSGYFKGLFLNQQADEVVKGRSVWNFDEETQANAFVSYLYTGELPAFDGAESRKKFYEILRFYHVKNAFLP